MSATCRRDEQQEIASDQLDDLRENPQRCAWLSVHAGRHPYVAYSEEYETYVIVEITDYGAVEIEACTKDSLVNLFAENPVDIMPKSDADFSPMEAGRRNLWEYVEERGENVTVASPELAKGGEDDAEC